MIYFNFIMSHGLVGIIFEKKKLIFYSHENSTPNLLGYNLVRDLLKLYQNNNTFGEFRELMRKLNYIEYISTLKGYPESEWLSGDDGFLSIIEQVKKNDYKIKNESEKRFNVEYFYLLNLDDLTFSINDFLIMEINQERKLEAYLTLFNQ